MYCGKWRKISRRNLDLGRQCLISNLSELFTYTTMYLNGPRSISFRVIMQTHTHTHENTHGCTQRL